MSGDVRFGRDEIGRLTEIAFGARDALVDRMRAEFSDDEWAEALCFTLAIMAASGFIPDAVDMSKAGYPILWRMTPAVG
jgi:hypothetical protein